MSDWEKALIEAIFQSIMRSIAEGSPNLSPELYAQRAAEYAAKVGGRLIVEVTETFRQKAGNLASQAITEGHSVAWIQEQLVDFSASRRLMIARTEIVDAYNAGDLLRWGAGGMKTVDVMDGLGCLPLGHVREGQSAPRPSGKRGTVEHDAEADGQNWTMEQASELKTAHPNCGRSFLPTEEEEES